MSEDTPEVTFTPRSLSTRDFTLLKPTTPRTTPTPDPSSLGAGTVTARPVIMATTYYSTVPTLGFKLKGKDNYPQFVDRAEGSLKSAALWRYVIGTRPRPSTTTIGETAEQLEDRQDAWDAKDQQARTFLYVHCANDIQVSLIGTTTAAAVWEKLKTYSTSGLASEYSAYLEWNTMYYDGTNVETFVTQYTLRWQSLKGGYLAVSETQAVYHLLMIIEGIPALQNFASSKRNILRETAPPTLGQPLPEPPLKLHKLIANLLDEVQAQETSTKHQTNLAIRSKPQGSKGPAAGGGQ